MTLDLGPFSLISPVNQYCLFVAPVSCFGSIYSGPVFIKAAQFQSTPKHEKTVSLTYSIAAGITKKAKPKPTAAQRDFLYDQAQNRAWLEAQRQIKGYGINSRIYKHLIRLFSYKTETERHAPAKCIEGIKLSSDSRAVWDRLEAERAEALLAQHKEKRAKKWWVSELEKRKVVEALEKMGMEDKGEEGEQPKGRKKTYKEVKREKHAAYIAAKIIESRQARAEGGKFLSIQILLFSARGVSRLCLGALSSLFECTKSSGAGVIVVAPYIHLLNRPEDSKTQC